MFLHITIVLPYSRKMFFCLNRALWCQATDQVCVIVSITWRSPATILLVFYKQILLNIWVLLQEWMSKVKCCIMAIVSSTLWRPLYSLFSYCFSLYRLEVIFQHCNNLSLCLSMHTSIVKHPNHNKWFD